MTSVGAFTFVLHSHIPYARQAGMWPHGEEWIHEAIAETYVPLLNALYDLIEEGVDFRLTVSITPILAEQLADPLIVEHFVHYAAERSAWAADDVQRFSESGETVLRDLARFYHHLYARILTSFNDRFNRDILGAFAALQERGFVEISTSAATHGYLPLLSRDSSIYGQIATGVASHERHFGRKPKAIWLPECAYRPAYFEGETRRPGIESFLAAQGIQVFFSETHTVEGGNPVGKAAGEAIGPYGEIQRRYSVSLEPHERDEPATTFKPYWVGDAPGKVAVLARNNDSGQQVWSATFGYPGDFWYREFHKKDGVSGLQYWRVGGSGLDLAYKPFYEPIRAGERVKDHARHFAGLIDDLLSGYAARSDGDFGVISAAYDTELFGHWWFEGVDWLKEVLRNLAANPRVQLTTASGIIEEHSPDRVLDLPESSWGAGGGHFTWMNVDTKWMWPLIHGAETRMESLAQLGTSAPGKCDEFIAQAARELLLLQSSDWPFLVTTGQAKEYAIERFVEHLERFNRIATVIEQDGCETPEAGEMLSSLSERDNPFPAIDFTDFLPRQGSAS
ncbi:MAG: glycoside hydrolase family 57 protein [Thermomicrobiales bacterium]